MAELPFHLKTIESLPGALDIIRLLGDYDEHTADADEICNALDLSDRRFSKAIRRLVTKGYVVMDGDMVYRLSEQGEEAAGELVTYDEEAGNEPLKPDTSARSSGGPKAVERHLVLALPQTLTANAATNIVVGFSEAENGNMLENPADLVLRVSVINGEPQSPDDTLVKLANSATQQAFEIVPGAFKQVRVRIEVLQLDNFSGDINRAGGMYVDVDVTPQQVANDMIAYSANVALSP
jgi:DNA-binding MarR family transcriptional regulator